MKSVKQSLKILIVKINSVPKMASILEIKGDIFFSSEIHQTYKMLEHIKC